MKLGEKISVAIAWVFIPVYIVGATVLITRDITWDRAAEYFGQRDHSQYELEWDTCKIYWVGKSFSIAAIDEAAKLRRACREAH